MGYTYKDGLGAVTHYIDSILEDSDKPLKEIAKAIGVQPRELTRWRTGQHDIRLQHFIALLDTLRIPPSDAAQILDPAAYIRHHPFL